LYAGKTDEVEEKIKDIGEMLGERQDNRSEGLNIFKEICDYYGTDKVGFVGQSNAAPLEGMFYMYDAGDKIVWGSVLDGYDTGEALYNGDGTWSFYGNETSISLTADLFFVAKYEDNKFVVIESDGIMSRSGTYASGQEGYNILQNYIDMLAAESDGDFAAKEGYDLIKGVAYLGSDYVEEWERYLTGLTE